ncbi:MarR family winged helix-turn-helix transcriptional regulator [Actinoplanes sp. M2I2]|uniref:MarR family winged helix-turn-helix transcriptional regulator n=1 Tax=Actinoplanes sp. M2I2 TaxID=1734444 RepID=UPI0020202892|nr:MarR family transcriptional regulator [Actinoplanes sp. M2I2]
MEIGLTENESFTWRNFVRMQTRLKAALAQALQEESGLSYPDYQVLFLLSEATGHALRGRDLRVELQWEKSRLAHQLRRMEGRGLLIRESCAEDPRAPIVKITAAGLASVQAAAPAHVARIHDLVFKPLTDGQAADLDAIAQAILHGLRDRPSHRSATS